MSAFAYLIFFFLTGAGDPDSLIVSSDIEGPLNVSIIDERSWIARNSGALIGALGGAFSAILAAILTNYVSNRIRKKKEKKVYEGVLYSIHTELHWQLNHTTALKNQLSEIRRISKLNGNFCVDKAPNSYDPRYLEYCRQRLLEYDNFDHEIVALLSTHINKLNETNANIDFSVAKNMKVPEGESITKEQIDEYFNKIDQDNIQKVEQSIPLIRTLIEYELKDFPKELFVESELSKKSQ